jgi:hypothetical protein
MGITMQKIMVPKEIFFSKSIKKNFENFEKISMSDIYISTTHKRTQTQIPYKN